MRKGLRISKSIWLIVAVLFVGSVGIHGTRDVNEK
jgi:hypothetical protein